MGTSFTNQPVIGNQQKFGDDTVRGAGDRPNGALIKDVRFHRSVEDRSAGRIGANRPLIAGQMAVSTGASCKWRQCGGFSGGNVANGCRVQVRTLGPGDALASSSESWRFLTCPFWRRLSLPGPEPFLSFEVFCWPLSPFRTTEEPLPPPMTTIFGS